MFIPSLFLPVILKHVNVHVIKLISVIVAFGLLRDSSPVILVFVYLKHVVKLIVIDERRLFFSSCLEPEVVLSASQSLCGREAHPS